MSPGLFDRRLLLAGAAAFAAPVLAQTPAKKAEITFRTDEDRIRALFGKRASASLQRILADRLASVAAEPTGLRLKLRRPEDFAVLWEALPRLDPAPAGFFETARRLELQALPSDEARIVWSDAALTAQAELWRDRARKMLEAALGARKPAFANRDANGFSLTLEGMDKAQWLSWIGARIDLFTPIPFALAPVAEIPDAKSFSPRPAPRGGLDMKLAVDGEKLLDNAEDIFLARVEGEGAAERLILDVTRAGAEGWAARKPPLADKTAYALLFDKALVALAVLDGPASERHLRFRIEQGPGAGELAERILLGGSAPQVRQVEVKFG